MDYTDPPKFPPGTPEYEAYAAELRTELGKFARGEEPYPYPQSPRELSWVRIEGGHWRAAYSTCGHYEVRWEPYGQAGKTWTAYHNGQRIPLSFSSRLKDAKQSAQKHSDRERGESA